MLRQHDMLTGKHSVLRLLLSISNCLSFTWEWCFVIPVSHYYSIATSSTSCMLRKWIGHLLSIQQCFECMSTYLHILFVDLNTCLFCRWRLRTQRLPGVYRRSLAVRRSATPARVATRLPVVTATAPMAIEESRQSATRRRLRHRREMQTSKVDEPRFPGHKPAGKDVYADLHKGLHGRGLSLAHDGRDD